ncbi:LSU ribosomal protein L21P [Octadecabacter temperatus]|uniref:Large ribosomal subunit protein bL21 n=1 Tax=Octadecabacter temperatus TaxID=1458307 RepID=A0A0K0Y548_9RHOB|nr:50S ribosomal protein L21 [Octadecabacter temperatus]AKS46113.1 50S ribosomal protein L21 [Octadecabacter temperatus]SIO07709.1 LSU ribosomal protein L21P [Octadecabacter temperatus]
MFAVLKTGGKQYRVESGDVLRVEKVAAEAGETVQFNEILMVGNNVGAPLVKDAGVQAEVIDQIKGEKTINFVKRRRKHSSKRTKGHRQQLTLVRITDILEKGADKSGVKAALNGSGFMSADMIERAANKGAPSSKKAEAAAARASQPKKAAAKKAAPKAAKPAAEKAAPKKAAPKKAAAKTDGADDLTRISGVGPVIVKKLHDLDVTTFAQIAAWTPADIADMDDKLNFKGRIDRDEWLKQAAEFAKG